jgi:hypothetical protein
MDKDQIAALNRNSKRMRENARTLVKIRNEKLAKFAGINIYKFPGDDANYFMQPQPEGERKYDENNPEFLEEIAINWDPSNNLEQNYLCETTLIDKGKYQDVTLYYTNGSSHGDIKIEFATSSNNKDLVFGKGTDRLKAIIDACLNYHNKYEKK